MYIGWKFSLQVAKSVSLVYSFLIVSCLKTKSLCSLYSLLPLPYFASFHDQNSLFFPKYSFSFQVIKMETIHWDTLKRYGKKYKESKSHPLSHPLDVAMLASVLAGTHGHGHPHVSGIVTQKWVYPLLPLTPCPTICRHKDCFWRNCLRS